MNIVMLLGLSPYLSTERVEKALSVSHFLACSTVPEGLYTIRFSISHEGKARLLEGEECFSSVEEISFPKHPHKKQVFEWDVIHQGGVLFPQTLRQEKTEVLFPGIFADRKDILLNKEEQTNE